MIVVVDTSVLLAALLRQQGFVHDLLVRLAEQRYVFCVSSAIIDELVEKAREISVHEQRITQFLIEREEFSIIGDQTSYSRSQISRDDHVIGCYERSQAELVLTNDKALIRRLKQLDIPAIRPSEFQVYLS